MVWILFGKVLIRIILVFGVMMILWLFLVLMMVCSEVVRLF